MRPRLWLTATAATVLVTAGGFVGATRPQAPTGLEFLKPNIVKLETRYQRIAYRGTPAKTEYRRYQTFTLRGTHRNHTMEKVCASFPTTKGWRYDGCSLMSTAFLDSPMPQKGLVGIEVYEDTKATYVETIEILTPAQAALVRLQHAGKDPFEKYPVNP